MTHRLGPKARDCLQLAADHKHLTYAEWRARYNALCARYSEKAVERMYERLGEKGYTDYGVSSRTGWPTDKGKAALIA